MAMTLLPESNSMLSLCKVIYKQHLGRGDRIHTICYFSMKGKAVWEIQVVFTSNENK